MRHATDLAAGRGRRHRCDRARGRRRCGLARRCRRTRDRAARAARARARGAREELRELAVRLTEVGSELHRFVASLDPIRAGRGGRGPARPHRELRRRSPRRLSTAARSPRRRRDRARRARRRRRPCRGRCGGGGSAEKRFGRGGSHCGRRATAAAEPFAAAVAENSTAWDGRGRVPHRAARARAGPDRPRRDVVPDSAERRACRSGRSPRPPRVASFPGSHSPSPRCGRRDARVRRDRCRDRRRHRASASPRRCARLAERAQVITITHLPQIASVADAISGSRRCPGDPTHTRIEALAASERASRARTDARR